MVRSFDARPLPDGLVDRLVDLALQSPTAGNARGTAWVVLQGPTETARYWDATTTPEWRSASKRWPGLSRAPAAVLALASPDVYAQRYREPDKALSADAGDWPVPYWWGDAAFGVMTLLLAAQAEALGACFLGNFRGEAALLAALGVPDRWRLFGTVLLGHPDGLDHRSPSLTRDGPPGSTRVHHGSWQP